MPKSTPKASSSKTYKRGFKKRADEIATNCRKIFNLKDYDPLESFLLVERLNLKIITPDELFGLDSPIATELLTLPGSDRWSAITLAVNGQPSHILYNTSHSVARVQSDIMHELAHVLLGHKMEEIDMSLGLPLRNYDDSQEHEAEWLGGCLQLPKPALVKYSIFQKFSVEQIADLFKASVQMVRYRIGVCGINVLKERMGNKANGFRH